MPGKNGQPKVEQAIERVARQYAGAYYSVIATKVRSEYANSPITVADVIAADGYLRGVESGAIAAIGIGNANRAMSEAKEFIAEHVARETNPRIRAAFPQEARDRAFEIIQRAAASYPAARY